MMRDYLTELTDVSHPHVDALGKTRRGIQQ